MKYKRLKKELAYKAHIFDVYNDYLELPDGKKVVYDLIEHVNGACVLPVDEKGNMIFVKQYRNALDRETYEVPAGCLDKDEDGMTCAKRELKEETGYEAEKMVFVTKTVLAIGTSDEQTDIYVGFNLKKGETNLDREEFIETYSFDMSQVDKMIKNGDIVDSKTLIAIYAYKDMLH